MTRKPASALALAAALGAVLALPAPVLADEMPSEAEMEAILDVLDNLECEMDPDDIEIEDEGYELDDVFCADGQYDIELNKQFEVVEKRKE
ncbi:PepSY domain-containing protein [Marinibacterium sp. SX1]|uniref:PepSY domain-containing protein n=1 Tax=Marinibacterium sp. SX1 TaxID=3388424 RepID=UPI003D16315A